jgi:hypothetical protein
MIGGASTGDADVPAAPVFAVELSRSRGGSVELNSVSFPDPANTRTITAGTLVLYYWDELNGASQHALASGMAAEDGFVSLTAAGAAEAGSFVQIEKEVLRVEEALDGGTRYRVTRAAHASTAAAHAGGTAVYHLQKKVDVVPFVRDFFGSAYSGNWSHVVELPNVRVASAEFSVTNSRGNSEVSEGCLTQNVDAGLRTLSGGQFSIQVEGFLAVDSAPAPELIVEATRSVRDVFAVVREAADGEIRLAIKQNGAAWCELAIAAGGTMSGVADGFGLAPLAAGARVSLEVLAVGTTEAGADLSVVIRL